MNANPSKEYDFITSIASAKKFHDVGKSCLAKYKNTKTISPTDVFASATNYGLAVELYLKSLLIMEGDSNIKGHYLDDLYNKLTPNTKEKIKKEYQNIGGHDRKDTLYIRASMEGSNPTNSNDQPARGTKFDQVLKNNKDMFLIYRYMFENGRSQKWKYFYFEYGNLDLVISSLDKVAMGMLSPSQVQKVNIT
jgi:hypothetical protein